MLDVLLKETSSQDDVLNSERTSDRESIIVMSFAGSSRSGVRKLGVLSEMYRKQCV
jgi:hypothetical protein